MASKSTTEKVGFHLNLRLIAGLSTVLLFLLLVFASHYQFGLEEVEEHTGVLEMMAAAIPLLSLLLAAIFSTSPKKRPSTRHRTQSASSRTAPVQH
jgi:hypothetical protein